MRLLAKILMNQLVLLALHRIGEPCLCNKQKVDNKCHPSRWLSSEPTANPIKILNTEPLKNKLIKKE